MVQIILYSSRNSTYIIYIRFSSAMCIRSVCCAKNLHIYELMNEIFHCAWSQHHKYGNRYRQHPTDFSQICRQGWCTHIQESSCVCASVVMVTLFVWYILSDIFSFDCIKRGNLDWQTTRVGDVLIQFQQKLEYSVEMYTTFKNTYKLIGILISFN